MLHKSAQCLAVTHKHTVAVGAMTMNNATIRARIRRALVLPVTILAAWPLGGCRSAEKKHEAVVIAKMRHDVALTDARLLLPIIHGHPAVAYFTLTNYSRQDVTLVGVHIEGVDHASMHQTVGGRMDAITALVVHPATAMVFAPGGRHVMVSGVQRSLTIGGTGQITLHFKDGKIVAGPLKLDASGADSSAAPMKM